MASIVDSFWTEDYSTGVNALFEALTRGCDQNELYIQLFASRMEFEANQGKQLCQMDKNIEGLEANTMTGFTLDHALHTLVLNMQEEGNNHLMIASDIESTVLRPFSKWCEEHKQRVEYSRRTLKTNVANFQKSRKLVERHGQVYFGKCRQYEDFRRSKFNEEELNEIMKSLKVQQEREILAAREREFTSFGKVGNIDLDFKSMREIVHALLSQLPKTEYKVPLINFKIPNTNSGSEIVKFLMEHVSVKDADQAEVFGQDLLDKGFLKYCNGVGTTFVNSRKFQYSWRDYAYRFARISPDETETQGLDVQLASEGKSNSSPDLMPAILTSSSTPDAETTTTSEKTVFSDAERTLFKLKREVEDSDKKYQQQCIKVDALRCSLEELIIDHYAFMEKCEVDRLKALKKVVLDFSTIMGGTLSSFETLLDQTKKIELGISPAEDLANMIKGRRTGYFRPMAISYNNYYNPGGFQNFGIELDTRCRLDKRVVPLLVSAILSYMDLLYPELPNDSVRTRIWTAPVKLSLTHEIRSQLNQTQFETEAEIFEVIEASKVESATLASAMKIYLMELPVALITDDICEILKTIYSEFPISSKVTDQSEANDQKRVAGLSNALHSLSTPHLATLDAITSHFSRLIKIIKMGEKEIDKDLAGEFTNAISQQFSNCILHNNFPEGNDLGFKIFHDLLTYRKPIFRNLKRQNSRGKDLNQN